MSNDKVAATFHPDSGPNYHADDPIGFGELAKQMHEIAKDHGFWELPRNFGEMLALVHSELSEALEAHRSRKPAFYLEAQSYGPDKPEGTLIELIDAVIRLGDMMADIAEREGLDIDHCMRLKMLYNESRPHKHGKRY